MLVFYHNIVKLRPLSALPLSEGLLSHHDYSHLHPHRRDPQGVCLSNI